MKILVLSVACLVATAVSLPANRQRRDILPGDLRYRTDYHPHHHNHDHHEFARTVNAPSQAYGPPGYEPSNPIISPEPTYELPTIQVNSFKPEIPSTSYGVPVQQNHHDHYEQHQEHHEHQQQQQYYQQYHHEHHYQQPQQHFQIQQQRQELRYTPQVSYGAPVPVKTAPVTSYGTPVESHVQNTHVPVQQTRAPAPDYRIQIYRSQPVKINFQPLPVHKPHNNGYHYAQPAPQPTPQPTVPQPEARPAPQPAPQPGNNGHYYHPQPVPQPAPQPAPQPGNNGDHYYPQPAPQPIPQPAPRPAPKPAPQPIPQPTHNNNNNNGYNYPRPQPAPQTTPKPDNTYLAPVEKKPTTTVNHYHPQPVQPTNQYLTPVVEDKKAPVQTYQLQPSNQYLAPVEQKPQEPELRAVFSHAVHDEEAGNKQPSTSSGSPFPSIGNPIKQFNINQFFPPNLNQINLPDQINPGQFNPIQSLEVPQIPSFPTIADFPQFDAPQILSDAISSVSETFSEYVNQKPAEPEATNEKAHNEPIQQLGENGGYVY